MCSLINVAHFVLCVLVLVDAGCVAVVHIGHEDVLVVIQFCVASFVVIFCIKRCTLYMSLTVVCLVLPDAFSVARRTKISGTSTPSLVNLVTRPVVPCVMAHSLPNRTW